MFERYIVKDFEYPLTDGPFGEKRGSLQLKAGTWDARIADHDVAGLFTMGVIGRDPETGQHERPWTRPADNYLPEDRVPGRVPPNERERPAEAKAAVAANEGKS